VSSLSTSTVLYVDMFPHLSGVDLIGTRNRGGGGGGGGGGGINCITLPLMGGLLRLLYMDVSRSSSTFSCGGAFFAPTIVNRAAVAAAAAAGAAALGAAATWPPPLDEVTCDARAQKKANRPCGRQKSVGR